MRALALTHVFPRSAEDPSAPFLLTWARALAEAGVDIAVIAPHDAGLPARHTVAGVPVRRVRYAPEGWERLAYRGEMHQLARSPVGPPLLGGLLTAMARSVRAQLRAGAPEVLHVHWWMPGAVIARLARPRTPVVCTVHGTDVALIEARPPLAGLARWALDGADRVEAVSADLAERLEQLTGRRPDGINPMPLDPAMLAETPRRSTPADDGGPLRVLAVGRLLPEKGFGDLIAALSRLVEPAELTLVGEGPERDRLAAQARALGVPLELRGRLSPEKLRRAYADADVVAQPSHREGFGLVAAEALVAGTPVVATDSGGVRELLPDSDLVAVGDVTGLTARLAMVAANRDAARAHARAHGGRARQLLTPSAAAQRTLAGYAALVAGGLREGATG